MQTLAHLGTVLAKPVGRTLELTERTPVPLRAATASVLGVTGGVVAALAHLRTVRAPAIWWAVYIARLPNVSLIAAARFRRDALSMPTSRITHRHAPIRFGILLVPGAALFQDPFLVDTGGFVHNLRPHSIRRTSRWNSNAPLLVPFLVGYFPGGRYEYLVLLDLLAHVWTLQIIVDYQLGKLSCRQGSRQDHNQSERFDGDRSYASHFA